MNSKTRITIFIFRILPKSLLSRIFGYITRIPLPSFMMSAIIKWYSRRFNLKDEFDIPEGGFRTMDDFFTRRLRAGVHVIDRGKDSIVSPVDARIDEFGKITDGTLIQAKGITYSLKDLVPSEYGNRFSNGFFMTLYLSPGDYHRIHSPVDGNIEGFFHIPGKLYTVQEFMVAGLHGLFSLNERLISYISTHQGAVAVCKVGAMNVGRISLSYNDIVTNRTLRKKQEVFFKDNASIPVKKGDELGTFHLGSTVILLFENNALKPVKISKGQTVRVGDKIAEASKPSRKKT